MNEDTAKPIDIETLSKTRLLGAEINSERVCLADYSKHFNHEWGLQRVGGNKKLFEKLLNDFYHNHGQDDERIRLAIEEQKLNTGKRLVHTIETISGTIGAKPLEKSARALGAALADTPSDSLAASLSDFIQCFQSFMEALAHLEGYQIGEVSDPSCKNR